MREIIVTEPIHREPGKTASRRGVMVGTAAASAIGMFPHTLRAATEDRENGRPAMTTTDEERIRQLIARSVEAIRAMNLEALKAIYAPDIVSFDVGPDLQNVGAASKLQNWVMAFTVFQPPIGYEVRDLTVIAGDDMAFTHSINRLSGTFKNGNGTMTGPWVRNTNVYRKIDGAWF
ncbi:MAG TPA: nuclear transport factor 2 family protein, partial [Rhizomicrobium sp.]|nr:nuclear transport factor 2 family protein [Rhizomicrobium sp.]